MREPTETVAAKYRAILARPRTIVTVESPDSEAGRSPCRSRESQEHAIGYQYRCLKRSSDVGAYSPTNNMMLKGANLKSVRVRARRAWTCDLTTWPRPYIADG